MRVDLLHAIGAAAGSGVRPAIASACAARDLLRLLDQVLTPKQARLVRMKAAGLSYAEIAENEGLTLTNVDKHLAKAAEKLREARRGAK